VGKIGGDAGGIDDIVEGELIDKGAELEEEGQRLLHVASASLGQ
jgi:hypothetical protein